VNTVELVVQFELEDMRRKQFEFEDRLKPLLQAESRSLDNLMHPPNVPSNRRPRWAVTKGEKMLIATDTTLDLTLNFHDAHPQDGVLAVVSKHASVIDEAVGALLPPEKIRLAGCVVTVNFSYEGPQEDVEDDIARMLLKAPPLGKINSANVAVGYRGRSDFPDFNFNYTANGYVMFNVTVDPTSGPLVASPIDVDRADPKERGLQIRVDVNDRDVGSEGPAAAHRLTTLIPACRDALISGLQEFLQDDSVVVADL